MPLPGARDDVFETLMFWFPAQFADGFFCRGDESRRIARATRFLNGLDSLARDGFAALDYLTDGIAIAVAEIVKALSPGLECEYERLGKRLDIPSARREVDPS